MIRIERRVQAAEILANNRLENEHQLERAL